MDKTERGLGCAIGLKGPGAGIGPGGFGPGGFGPGGFGLGGISLGGSGLGGISLGGIGLGVLLTQFLLGSTSFWVCGSC